MARYQVPVFIYVEADSFEAAQRIVRDRLDTPNAVIGTMSTYRGFEIPRVVHAFGSSVVGVHKDGKVPT